MSSTSPTSGRLRLLARRNWGRRTGKTDLELTVDFRSWPTLGTTGHCSRGGCAGHQPFVLKEAFYVLAEAEADCPAVRAVVASLIPAWMACSRSRCGTGDAAAA